MYRADSLWVLCHGLLPRAASFDRALLLCRWPFPSAKQYPFVRRPADRCTRLIRLTATTHKFIETQPLTGYLHSVKQARRTKNDRTSAYNNKTR